MPAKPMSKAEKKWIKRKIGGLLETFDSKSRHQIALELKRITRELNPK